MAVTLATLFTRLGKGMHTQRTVNTARLTTVPTPVKAYQDAFDAAALPLKKAMAPVEGANRGFQAAGSGLVNSLKDSMANTLIEMYQADANLDSKDLTTALQTLIRQMVTDAASVDASAVAATASAITGTGDGVLVASAKRADGKSNENLLAETIRITCASDTTPAKAGFSAKGDVAVSDRLSQDWPLGSGCSRGLTANDGGTTGILTNGDFDDWTLANIPDYWVPSVATIGTTLKSTSYEVQTLTVTGPPTAGTYILNFTDTAGKVRSTAALAYNATAATLQTELRKFPGLELLTVTATGTTPNWIHTITFTGYAGNPARLRTTNNTTAGVYTHATTTQGSSVAEVQTVAISGTPTGGTYTLTYVNAAGTSQTTAAIVYNASSATVQAALRLLNELEEITIVESGTTPNFTHTITFTGIGGNLTQLTSTSSLTGGTPVITHGTTTNGINLAFIGKAVEFDSDASQLTTLNQKVSLDALTQYAFNFWMLADVVPAAGVITVDLVDGIGGTVVNDEAGTANSFTITCSALTTSFVAKNGVFRTPKIMPTAVYLRIRITTAVSAGSSIYFDHASLVKMDELYKGGPSAAIFSGKAPMRKSATDGQVEADYFVLTTTNDFAGDFQTYFERNFAMRDKGLLLPSNSAGAETILDTLLGA